jgi:hypothetical protein
MIATFSIDLDVDNPDAIARALRDVADQLSTEGNASPHTARVTVLSPTGSVIIATSVVVGEEYTLPVGVTEVGEHTVRVAVSA